MAGAAPYLIVHDGSETKDADVDIILLAHQPRVLQSPAPRKRAVPGGEAAVGEGLGVLTVTQTAGCPLAAAEKGERTLHRQPRERGTGGRASAVSPPRTGLSR